MEEITHEMRKKYWYGIVEQCCNSGMPKEKWLKEHNINDTAYYNWQRRYRQEVGSQLLANCKPDNEPQQLPTLQIVELAPTVPKEKAGASITIGNSKIEIDENISDALLQKIVRALRDA